MKHIAKHDYETFEKTGLYISDIKQYLNTYLHFR